MIISVFNLYSSIHTDTQIYPYDQNKLNCNYKIILWRHDSESEIDIIKEINTVGSERSSESGCSLLNKGEIIWILQALP